MSSGFWKSIRERLFTSSRHRGSFPGRPSDPDSQQSIEGTRSVSCDLLVVLPKTELNRIDGECDLDESGEVEAEVGAAAS